MPEKVKQRFTHRVSYIVDTDVDVERGADGDWAAMRSLSFELPMNARAIEVKTINRRYVETPAPEAPAAQPELQPETAAPPEAPAHPADAGIPY